MEKELIQLYESARKNADAAADGGVPEEDRCLDVLNRLKKFPVSYQLLASTRVGKRLRGLTKHKSNKIKVLASEVIEIWKDLIVKETMYTRNGEKNNQGKPVKREIISPERNGPTGGSNSDQKAANGGADKVVVKVAAKIKFKKMIKEEKSTSDELTKPKEEPVDPPKLNFIIYCNDTVRDRTREILGEALCKVSGEVAEDLRNEVNSRDPYRVAVLVETAMFEKLGKSNGVQKAKYRSIIFNIKDSNNPDFRRKVLLGQIATHTIPELTPEQMASNTRKEQNDKIKKKALFECERGLQQKEGTNKQFRCGRCGKRETTYYQMQTRSADEAMTSYITCVVCGNRWKC